MSRNPLLGEGVEKYTIGWRKGVVKVRIGKSTDKKENQIFLIYKEIQNGAGAKSYKTNGLSYMGKYLRISTSIRKPFLIYDVATAPL